MVAACAIVSLWISTDLIFFPQRRLHCLDADWPIARKTHAAQVLYTSMLTVQVVITGTVVELRPDGNDATTKVATVRVKRVIKGYLVSISVSIRCYTLAAYDACLWYTLSAHLPVFTESQRLEDILPHTGASKRGRVQAQLEPGEHQPEQPQSPQRHRVRLREGGNYLRVI